MQYQHLSFPIKFQGNLTFVVASTLKFKNSLVSPISEKHIYKYITDTVVASIS
jgi:hypothetical protein